MLYLPASASELTITGGTYQDLLDFLSAENCTADQLGQIMPRNSCRSPWVNTLDGRLAFKLPIKKVGVDITLDALNLINLFNRTAASCKYTFVPADHVLHADQDGQPGDGLNISTINLPTYQAVLPRRPAVALAAAAGRAGAILEEDAIYPPAP